MDTFAINMFVVSVLIFLFSHGTLAQLSDQQHKTKPFGGLGLLRFQGRQCRLERLSTLEPLRRVQSEAGFTEHFDESNEQLQCVGVAVQRRTVEPRGLTLPSYSNTPRLIYVVQGRGIFGSILPGCPESFQSFQQIEEQVSEEVGQRQRRIDEHQKVRQVRQGDVIALPAGVTHWFYNDGDRQATIIMVHDTQSSANQLEPQHREFLLAGRQQGTQQSTRPEEIMQGNNNMLSGFSTDFLAEAFGVDRWLARKIQNQEKQTGEIVSVRRGLQVMRASTGGQRWEREEGTTQEEGRGSCTPNGLEENYCFIRNHENIERASLVDVYNPRGGRITNLNSQKLPMLRSVQMSVERGVLYRNAVFAPYWNINAHSIMYVLRGNCRCQVVGHQGRSVFDGEVRQGQLLVIPQNFAVLKRAQADRCEWISFKTNHNAMASQIVGKASAFRGIPLDVLANSFGITGEEARALKFNRGEEMSIFTPRLEVRQSV